MTIQTTNTRNDTIRNMIPTTNHSCRLNGPPVLFSQIWWFLAGHDPRSYDSSGTAIARRVVGCNHRARPAEALLPGYYSFRRPRDGPECPVPGLYEADTGLSRRQRLAGGAAPSTASRGLSGAYLSRPGAARDSVWSRPGAHGAPEPSVGGSGRSWTSILALRLSRGA
jgi:hypothetical protein